MSAGVQEYERLFGRETHDEKVLFELLVVAVFQAGLSWQAAASKLPAFRRAFADFDPQVVAGFDEPEIERFLADPELIRNPRKLRAIVANARAIRLLRPEFANFGEYLWHFTNKQRWVMMIAPGAPLNQQSSLGTQVAQDMKRRGFKFVGPTTVQLFLLAAGVIQQQESEN